MKNFESFSSNNQENPEGEKTAEQSDFGVNKNNKNIFEKMYKSKILRALILAGAIGGAAKAIPDASQKETQTEIKYEKVEKNSFDLGSLQKNFSSKIETENHEGKYVVHIGQIHGGDSVEESKNGMESAGKNLEYLIERQKGIEKILLYLAERYQTKDVFVEGVDASLVNLVENVKKQIYYNENREKNNPQERWDAANYLSKLAQKNSSGLTQKHQAHLLYLAQCVLKNESENLFRAKESLAKNQQCLKEYSDIIKKLENEKVDIPQVINNLSKIQKEIGNNNLLKNERIYIWGGAMKLYMEGKINIHPTETLEANKEYFAKHATSPSFTKEELKTPDVQQKIKEITEERENVLKQRNDLRENVALDAIIKSRVSEHQQFIPLVYGEGHDFKDNVDKLNKENWNIGLLRLDAR